MRTSRLVTITVDYSKIIKRVINGDYREFNFFSIFSSNDSNYSSNENWIDVSQRFCIPKELVGKETVVTGKLFMSYNNTTCDREYIVSEMAKDGCRPANVYELLSLGESYRSNSQIFALCPTIEVDNMLIASIDLFPDYGTCLAIYYHERGRQLCFLNYGERALPDSSRFMFFYLGICK